MDGRIYKVMDVQGKESPPVEEAHLFELARQGFLLPDTMICDIADRRWFRAGDHPALNVIFGQRGVPVSKPRLRTVSPPAPPAGSPAVHERTQWEKTPENPIDANIAAGVRQGSWGPRDEVEWKTSCFWHWAWLLISAMLLSGACRVAWEFIRERSGLRGLWLIAVLGFAALTTYCVMRLRRLYVYHAFGHKQWQVPAAIVGGLFLLPLLFPMDSMTVPTTLPQMAGQYHRQMTEGEARSTFGDPVRIDRSPYPGGADVWHYTTPEGAISIRFWNGQSDRAIVRYNNDYNNPTYL